MYLSAGIASITFSCYLMKKPQHVEEVIDILFSSLIVTFAFSNLLHSITRELPKEYKWHLVYTELKGQSDVVNKSATRINRLLFSGLGIGSIGLAFSFFSNWGLIAIDAGILLIIISLYLNAHYIPPKDYNWELVFPELALGEIDEDEL